MPDVYYFVKIGLVYEGRTISRCKNSQLTQTESHAFSTFILVDWRIKKPLQPLTSSATNPPDTKQYQDLNSRLTRAELSLQQVEEKLNKLNPKSVVAPSRPDTSITQEEVMQLRDLPYGHLVRHLRVTADLTQKEISKSSQLDIGYISKVESGAYPSSKASTVKKLAEGLGLAQDDPRTILLLDKAKQARKHR